MRQATASRRSGRQMRPFHVLNLEPRVADIAQPPLGISLEAMAQQFLDGGWDVGRQRTPVRLVVKDRGQGVLDRGATKDLQACQRLVDDATEGPDIAAR